MVLWSGSWAFSTVLYALRLLPYRDLSWLTAALICGAVALFAGGASLGARFRPRRAPRAAAEQAQAVELGAWLLIALLGVAFTAFLAGLVSRFGLGQVLQISPGVKLYLSSGEAPLSGAYVEVAIAAATMCAMAAATVRLPDRRRRWLAATIACASTVYFSTSRAFIIVALIAALAAFLLMGAKVNRRWLATAGIAGVVVTLALFTGLGAVLGKTYGKSTIGEFDNFFSRHQIARPLALPYQDATASIPALDLLTGVSPTWGIAHGCATAPIACGVLRKVGVHALRVPVAGPFTQAPLQWNGYTFLERFLIDFGTALTLVLVAITGVLAGYWWTRARAGSLASTIVYAIGVPVLVAAYRQNLIEIALVASVIGVSVFLLCSAVVATASSPHRKLGGLRHMNSLLQRLIPAPPERVAVAGLVPETAVVAPAGVRHPKPPKARRVRPVPRGRVVDPPERVDVAGRIPKTKEECEHYARYAWASQLVRGAVLDVACGTGYGSRRLARSAHVTGVDRDQDAVEQARSRVHGAFLVADVPPIPIRAHAFDFVVCFETVEHIHDDVEFMREIHRVLRPGGRLLLSTPNADLSAEQGMPVNPWHVREHTLASVTTLLESAGLEVLDRYMQSFPPRFPRGHRIAWCIHGFTSVLPRGVRFVTRALLGDADVRPLRTGSRAPGYWVVIAAKGAQPR